MEMGEGGDGPLSLLYFVESNVFGILPCQAVIFHLADGSPRRTGFAVELSWSPAVIDGTSRSLCLCI